MTDKNDIKFVRKNLQNIITETIMDFMSNINKTITGFNEDTKELIKRIKNDIINIESCNITLKPEIKEALQEILSHLDKVSKILDNAQTVSDDLLIPL